MNLSSSIKRGAEEREDSSLRHKKFLIRDVLPVIQRIAEEDGASIHWPQRGTGYRKHQLA